MMKNLFTITILFIAGLTFSCCKDNDNGPDIPDDIDETIEWIYDKMVENYYWDEEIKSKQLDYYQEPKEFFYSLLSNKDGKSYQNAYGQMEHYYYSYIKENTETKANMGEGLSLGFEYQTYYDIKGGQYYYSAKILYVINDSPAGKNGLKRGEWIVSINDKPVTTELLSELNSGNQVKLEISDDFVLEEGKRRTIAISAQSIVDNPVFFNDVINYEGTNIGYLVYNHFTPGTNGIIDQTFNNSLKDAFRKFKTANVSALILDLRYNGGGYVACADTLASLIAPTSKKGEIFYKMEYNETLSKKYKSDYPLNVSSGSLNLNKLHVITSSRTASASELVIEGLGSHMDVYNIGYLTEGKNVGSNTISDEKKYNWTLHPIVCLVKVNSGIDYSKGIVPDYELKEDSNHSYELGDTNEPLLKAMLDYITKGAVPKSKSISEERDLKQGYNSLDNKQGRGMIFESLPQKE